MAALLIAAAFAENVPDLEIDESAEILPSELPSLEIPQAIPASIQNQIDQAEIITPTAITTDPDAEAEAEEEESADFLPKEKSDTSTISIPTINSIFEFHVGQILDWFGVDEFVCSNPTPLKTFDVAKLEGSWFQAHASRSTDVFGCVQYQFINDKEASIDDLPGVNLLASWTAFNTYWNPFEKGQYAKEYKLFADLNGRMFERQLLTRENTFSYIVATDYSTYFVEYACKQSLFDFWTIEYYDIFTKDGTKLGATQLDGIKTTLKGLSPNFDTNKLTEARSGGQCAYSDVWGIF